MLNVTVVIFVESNRHRPPAVRLVILGFSPPGRMDPSAKLETLYNHVLSFVDDKDFTFACSKLLFCESQSHKYTLPIDAKSMSSLLFFVS